MNTIKVPYMPIPDLTEPGAYEKLFKNVIGKQENSNDTSKQSLLFPEENAVNLDVVLALHGMGMEKYVELFQKEEIPLETFLELNDSDLQELGISDTRDRSIILKSLEIHQTKLKNLIVHENHLEDLRIANNLIHQLLLIQNYCSYIELQMRKQELVDYRITPKETACTYLKAFVECAITQSRILSRSLFAEGHSDNLIGKLIKMYNLTLPKHLQEKLRIRKKSVKSHALKVMVVLGFCSMIVLTGKCLIRK